MWRLHIFNCLSTRIPGGPVTWSDSDFYEIFMIYPSKGFIRRGKLNFHLRVHFYHFLRNWKNHVRIWQFPFIMGVNGKTCLLHSLNSPMMALRFWFCLKFMVTNVLNFHIFCSDPWDFAFSEFCDPLKIWKIPKKIKKYLMYHLFHHGNLLDQILWLQINLCPLV